MEVEVGSLMHAESWISVTAEFAMGQESCFWCFLMPGAVFFVLCGTWVTLRPAAWITKEPEAFCMDGPAVWTWVMLVGDCND